MNQDKCAMKIGTDSTLLGAWAEFDDCKRILDIGTGTGVLALMAAQRNKNAEITAVEIDDMAFFQASDNFKKSPWTERLHVIHDSIQNFKSAKEFDCIISNPPFFDHQRFLLSPDSRRKIARATETLTLGDLFLNVNRLMSTSGFFHLIAPYSSEEDILNISSENNLYLRKYCEVIPRENKAPNRLMLSFSKISGPVDKNSICIRKAVGSYHEYCPDFEYLLKDFLIIF